MSARLALSTLLAAAALTPPGLVRAQGLNVITAVELKDEGSTVVLSVKGSKPPNFTTFSMADPPRFVIDLSESRFDGVPEDLVVQDGIVNVVKNLSYGSDATSIARVMIAFQVDVEPPEVQTAGTTLVVRVAKPGAPAVAGGRPAAPAEDAAAAAAARAEAERQAAAEAETRARAEADARARADAEQRARDEQVAAQGRAEEERRSREQAEAKARSQAESEQRARDEAETRARARAEAEQRDQARLEAEAAAREEAEARARDEADAKRVREREAALAAAAGSPPPEPPPPVAAPPEPAPAAEPYAAAPSSVERVGAAAPSAQLREVGFRQMPGASRVFVRTSVPPRFTVQDVGGNTIRVEFENTRVARRNDTRFLDTSFFRSAVELITPSRRGSTYVVDIKLRERVPYQQRIVGDIFALDFERPAAPAPAPGPGAADAPPTDTAAPEAAPADAPAQPEGGTPAQRY